MTRLGSEGSPVAAELLFPLYAVEKHLKNPEALLLSSCPRADLSFSVMAGQQLTF